MKYLLALLLCLSFQAQAEYINLDKADVIATGACKHIILYQCLLVTKDQKYYLIAFNQKMEEVAIWSVKEVNRGYEEGERTLLWSRDSI